MLIDFHDDDLTPYAGYDDTEELLASMGIDGRHTPVDRFAGHVGAGLVLAHSMEYGDDPFPT